jgi:phosphoribosylamine---glycine ligase
MNVLVIGGGGREHAIIDALSKSKKVSKIYAAPGNAGIAQLAECMPIKDTDVDNLVTFAYNHNIALTVVGPEVALAAGVVNAFEAHGLKIFGPTKEAAQIESSKEFAKHLMQKYAIPTAAYEVFSDYKSAWNYVQAQSLPIVLKYDGLAAGKGVVIPETLKEAESALKDMLLNDKFGHGKVVIEEFITGPEFSFMCFVCRDKVYPMMLAQDHKRAFDGDKGPNTGGMGAYSPLPFITKADEEFAYKHIMQATANALVAEGCPFKGVLYGGLMKTPNGIKVIEFNARFGDPETEVVLPRLQSDITDIFQAIINETPINIKWDKRAAVGIVMASKGYPENYEKGFEIKNLDKVHATVYHMGTRTENGKILTNGGRVLFITVLAESLAEAQKKANEEVAKIECDNLFHRTDIAWQAIK